jgi:uncharacterized protein YecE (DUF72 family)
LRVAIEFRHATWLTKENRDETFEFLSAHGLAYVCVDTGRRKGAVPALPVATSKELAVVRFHGRARGRPGQRRSEQQYLYPTKVLQSWVPKLRALAGEADVVHAVFRNVYRDYAPRSAERLQRLVVGATPSSS